MSKSYDNTIPLFAPATELRRHVFSIVTDSRAPGEPKEAEGSALFQLYQAFASEDETASMRAAFASGIAWGDAKQALFERVEGAVAPMREHYETLLAQPALIEQRLQEGAAKARAIATPFLDEIRRAVGLRRLDSISAAAPAATARPRTQAQFKQYREVDGRFYFKLVAGDGTLLLQSRAFASPRDAGLVIARLKQGGDDDVLADAGELAPGISRSDISEVLATFGAE